MNGYAVSAEHVGQGSVAGKGYMEVERIVRRFLDETEHEVDQVELAAGEPGLVVNEEDRSGSQVRDSIGT